MAGTATDVSYWTGAVSNVATLAGNWATHSGSPTAPPATGESIRFDERAVRPMSSGVNSHFSGKTMAVVTKTPGMRHDIGGTGDALSCTITAGVIAGEHGDVYISGSITAIDIQGTGVGTVYVTSGTTTSLIMDAGNVVFGAGAVLTAFTLIGGNLQLEYNATDVTTGNVDGGRCLSYRDIDTGVVCGSLTLMDNAASDTIMTLHAGGVLNHKSRGTINELIAKTGCTYSRKDAVGDAEVTDSTIQTGANLMHLHAAGVETYINGTGSSNSSTIQGSLSRGGFATSF